MRSLAIVSIVLLVPTAAVSGFAQTCPPETPAPVDDILYARHFVLEEGYESFWQQERPVVTSGYIVVLKAEPTLVAPRAVPTPVLHAGSQSVEVVRTNYETGIVVGILRGDLDLTETRIWFGAPELAGDLTANMIKERASLATLVGVTTIDTDNVNRALATGGAGLHLPEKWALMDHIARVIETYGGRR